MAFGIAAFTMLAMMLYIDNFFSDRTLMVCMVLGMLYRVLADGNIYNFAGTAYAGLIAGAVAWKISGKPMARDLASFPAYLKLLTASGIWMHFQPLVVLLLVIILQVAGRKLQKSTTSLATRNLQPATKNWFTEWTIIAVTIITLLWV